MGNNEDFPFEIRNADPKLEEEFKKYIKGTTLTQELVWLVTNDLDYDTSQKVPLTDRYPFLEFSMYFDQQFKNDFGASKDNHKSKFEHLVIPGTEVVASTPSPRYVKTHLPLSLLPPTLLDTAKVVYVARDARDVAVSYYYFTKTFKMLQFDGDFKVFFDWFIRDIHYWSPYFEHVKEAWEKRSNPNMLFLFYEDLIKDLRGSARRVAEFFNKQYSEEQLTRLAEHLHFDNFQHIRAVELTNMKDCGILGSDMNFVRKGKSGGWREHFDAELAARAQAWLADNLRATDMRFPRHGD